MFKTKLCKFYIKGNCKNNNKCTFAHSNKELDTKKCMNGKNCYNEKCIYIHPNNWNPYENKVECNNCLNKFNCSKKSKKYIHKIIDDENNKVYENKEKINMILKNYNKEFPDLLNNNENEVNNKEKGKEDLKEIENNEGFDLDKLNIENIPITINFVEYNQKNVIEELNLNEIYDKFKDHEMIEDYNKNKENKDFIYNLKILNYNFNYLKKCIEDITKTLDENLDTLIDSSNTMEMARFFVNNKDKLHIVRLTVNNICENNTEYMKNTITLLNKFNQLNEKKE